MTLGYQCNGCDRFEPKHGDEMPVGWITLRRFYGAETHFCSAPCARDYLQVLQDEVNRGNAAESPSEPDAAKQPQKEYRTP